MTAFLLGGTQTATATGVRQSGPHWRAHTGAVAAKLLSCSLLLRATRRLGRPMVQHSPVVAALRRRGQGRLRGRSSFRFQSPGYLLRSLCAYGVPHNRPAVYHFFSISAFLHALAGRLLHP